MGPKSLASCCILSWWRTTLASLLLTEALGRRGSNIRALEGNPMWGMFFCWSWQIASSAGTW